MEDEKGDSKLPDIKPELKKWIHNVIVPALVDEWIEEQKKKAEGPEQKPSA